MDFSLFLETASYVLTWSNVQKEAELKTCLHEMQPRQFRLCHAMDDWTNSN